ncbi:MAG: transposase [Segatella oulorum]
MKNKLMPMWDKIMLRKRYIIKCINELLKNKANLVHSRHRSIHNFIMNLYSALTAYCFLTINLRLYLFMLRNQSS